MNGTRTVERLRVIGGDRQTVSHAGTHLLGELADRLGLTSGYSAALMANHAAAPRSPSWA